VNLASFAELAVRLVNSTVCDAEADPLRTSQAFRDFIADRPFLAAPVTQHDLDRLKLLRADLATVFTNAVAGNEKAAVDRLNNLLMIHPVQPMLVSHDGEPWHLHMADAGSIIDRYAAVSVISLSLLFGQLGAERFGICAIASCDRVFIDGSSNKSRRYCADHSAARTNVASLPSKRPGLAEETTGTVASAAS
jgi:predicted RNA-binding Zn ribbon-like protein